MLAKMQIGLFCAVLLWLACRKEGLPSPEESAGGNNRLLSFLALGDSYTIGQGVTPEERFPAQTRDMLVATGKTLKEVQYIATTGWTTVQLQAAIDQQQPKGPFDIVTLMIGVNDQHQMRDTTGYADRFTRLLQTAVELAGNQPRHVFVLSIPDYSVTPYGAINDTAMIRRQIEWYNQINYRVTMRFGIHYTNITGISREALDDPSLLAKDGLHPSATMYRRWAALLAPVIRQALP